MRPIFFYEHEETLSTSFEINSGVPQGSILGPLLYIIYSSDIPGNLSTTIALVEDDVSLFSRNGNTTTASENLQQHLYDFKNWHQNGDTISTKGNQCRLPSQ